MKRIAGVFPVVFLFITGYFFYLLKVNPDSDFNPNYDTILPSPTVTPTPSPELPESHIIPIRTFNLTNPEEVRIAFSPQNLQWLTKAENRKKGGRIVQS